MVYRGRNVSPIAAWILIAVNMVLSLVTLIVDQSNPDYMYFTYGLCRATFADQPWTLITSMFLHVGLWHLLANMITLYFFGSFLNRLLGTWRFLAVYFLSGIVGSTAYLLLGPAYVVAVGASGAIFGLGGVLAVMRPKLRVIVFPIPVPLPLWIAILGIFVIFSFIPGVAWQGHLGGLALGLVAGYIFRRRELRRYY